MRETRRFQFDVTAEVFMKADGEGKERRIGGICTTDLIDRQDEVVLQEGLDFSPFLKSGWFNDNHDESTDSILGYPTKAELRTLPNGVRGWYVEGYLLKGSEKAERIWDLANALQKTDRRLGFSVEGKILERDENSPNIVKKAIVTEVAITKCPVNTGTSLTVLAKSLSTGHAVSMPSNPSPGDGAALRVESLEGTPKKRKKKMKKSEAIELLMKLRPGTPAHEAEMIVDYALRHYPA